MKTILKRRGKRMNAIIVLILCLLSFGYQANAQEKKPATLYIFGAVNTRDNKSTVFSPTISVRVKDNSDHTRFMLSEQFKEYLKKYVAGEMGIDARVDVYMKGPTESRKDVDNDRLNWMKRSRESYGYGIIHTGVNFYFKFEEPEYAE